MELDSAGYARENLEHRMKIILATGIYPPDIGGHSFYVQSLEAAFEKMGHQVAVVLYGNLNKLPTGIRHLLYAWKLSKAARDADMVIGFDTFSILLPLALIAPRLGVPVFERAGGDFVWEQFSNRTKSPVPLPNFYQYTDRWSLKEKLAFYLIRRALERVHIVFSSEWQRDLWMTPYNLDSARVHVIENAIPERVQSFPPERKNFLFYGRQIPLKNAENFRRAFERARKHQYDIIIEEGVIPHDELLEKMQYCYAVALPSISDITPNYIVESIVRGKPFLLTKHSAYARRFAHMGVIVDPLLESDLVRGITDLTDPVVYERLSKNIAAFNEVRTYDDIAREFLALIQE